MINVAQIPPSITSTSRAVLWNLEERDGKPTKVPYNPTRPHEKASVTDPATWGRFSEAVDAHFEGKADGVGIVLGAGVVGVDIDKCRNVETGEIDPEALAIVRALDSYSEISPSGTGLHILVYGELPPGGRRKGRIEMYSESRYFTLTGQHVPDTPTEIQERTAALAALHTRVFALNGHAREVRRSEPSVSEDDTVLLERARAARNGDRFRRLYDGGDTSDHGGDESAADLALCNLLAFWTGADATRMDRLFRQSARIREKWDERRGEQTYGERTIERAIRDCRETYAPQSRHPSEPPRRKDGPRDEGAPPEITVGPAPDDRLTEAGAAERFARLHGDDVKHDHQRGRFLLYRGHVWRPDQDAAITRLALDFARTWQREAMDIPDPNRREAAFKAAIRLERRDALTSMLKLAGDLKPIADAGQGWDADPWLLGTPNGVVDLRTGRLRPGRRDDQITLSASAPYIPEAVSPIWLAALRAILVSDETIAFMQTAVGYSATGDVRRDVWFLGQGSGRNGKGTLYHPIRRALGDYAAELPAAVLDARRDSAPYDLATLPGKRFVISSEAGDTIRLNHDRIKQITGGDPMRCANKYEKSFEFQPVSKLWLAANRKPRVSDDSPAFWARVMLIPFTQTFLGREDRDLRPTLEHDPAHQAAILAWIVQGARRYAEQGLEPPEGVTSATAAYKQECDPLADFLVEACDPAPGAEIGASEFYKHYRDWAEQHCLSERERLSATMFGRLASTRFEKADRKRGRAYLGITRRPL